MKLGILVNTDRNSRHLSAITMAAVGQGHEVALFFMDDGINLLPDPSVNRLCFVKGVKMTYCDYNAKQRGLAKDGLPAEISPGSQYQNALMNHEADRVIVL